MEKDILLFMAGLVVGGMNAIAGGGTLIGFPIMLASGLSPLAANITSSLVVLPGSLSSAFGYRKYLRKLNRQYLLLLIPCIIGATIGAMILRNTSHERFQDIVPALVLFAVILFAFQPFLHVYLRRHIRRRYKALRPLVLISVALLPVAIYGGYFGAGFGFIMLAFLGFTKLHEIHTMNGLKNLASVCITLIPLICFYGTGLINWKVGMIMAAGSIIGGYYGAVFAQKIPSPAVRIIVIIAGVGTAAYLGVRDY